MQSKETGISFDPKKCKYNVLETMVRTVFKDPTKGLIVKRTDGPSIPVHAYLPEFNEPNMDKERIIRGLVPHLKAAEQIVPVYIPSEESTSF